MLEPSETIDPFNAVREMRCIAGKRVGCRRFGRMLRLRYVNEPRFHSRLNLSYLITAWTTNAVLPHMEMGAREPPRASGL